MAMGPTTPSLVSLDLFVSVVRFGSVSQAARVHGISQPAASARVSDLERRLGLQLLERRTSGSKPTLAGELVAEWAEAVLASAHHLLAAVEALRTDAEDRIRVQASYTVAEYLLPGWLSRFHRSWPKRGVELRVANSADVLSSLRTGEADLGFIESTDDVGELAQTTVAHDVLVVVVAPNHPWADRHSIDLTTLVGLPLVTREPGSGTRAVFDTAVAAAGLPTVRPSLELGSTSAVKAAVVNGTGPAVLSRLAVETDIAAGHMVGLAIEGADLSRQLRAVWPANRAMSDAATSLLSHVREATTHPR